MTSKMTLDKKLTVSASPHIRSSVTSTGIMLEIGRASCRERV